MGLLKESRHRARVSALLVSLLAVAGCAAKPSAVDRLQARAAYERAQADLRDGQIKPALSGFRQAAALDRGNAAYHNALGVVLLHMKLPETLTEAVAEFRTAIDIDDAYAEAHHNLGGALAESSRWKAAIAEYRKALALPTFAMPDVGRVDLGWALYNVGRYQEAEEALRFAIRLNPPNPTLPAAYYTLGLVLLQQSRGEEAKAAFRRARAADPNSTWGLAAAQHLRALGEGG